MKVALIFNKDREDTTGCYYERVLKDSKLDFKHFPTEGFEKVEERFNLYLRIDHGDYKYDIPHHIHPKAFLAIDTHLKKPYKKILRQAKHYDFIFTTQKEGTQMLSRDLRKEVTWIPLACDPQIHKRLQIQKKYDIGFVGSFGGKGSVRERILLNLKDNFPNSYIGNAPYAQMSQIYSSSKIGINYSLNNDINMRIFEILSCGTMLITSRIEDNGFNELFKEGHHLVSYGTEEELLSLIRYYLKHEKEREEIALSGYRLAINQHTYYNRLSKIFEVIRRTNEVQFRDLKI